MPIRFACPECKAAFQAPDHLAGKPVACPKCKKKITVPTEGTKTTGANPADPLPPSKGPVVVPPQNDVSTRESQEALDAFMSAERESDEASKATLIELGCPFCDEQIKFPLEMGGKQAPCPECSRIVKIPIPKRTDAGSWRANIKQGPSAVRRDLEPVPEGFQGGSKVEVSRESLEEADALLSRRPKVVVPVRQRIRQAVTFGVFGIVIAGVLGTFWWIRSGQQTLLKLDQVVREGEASIKDDKEFPPRAKMIYQLVGVEILVPYSNEVNNLPKKYTDPALAEFRKEKESAGSDPEALAPLDPAQGAMIRALLVMGGNKEEARSGKKANWDEIQQRIGASYALMTWPEFRLSVWRQTVKFLVLAKESKRALALLNTAFAEPKRRNRMGEEVAEKMDAAGILGHELLASGDKEGALQALALVLPPGARVNPSEVGEYIISLVIALGDQSQRLPAGTLDGELDSQILGRVRGYALIGEQTRLESTLKVAAKTPSLGFRARVELAISKPDDSNVRGQLAKDVLSFASRPEAQTAILRWAEFVGPGEMDAETLGKLFVSMPGENGFDREFRGWSHFVLSERKPGVTAGTATEQVPAVGDLLRAALPGENPKAGSQAAELLLAPFLKIGEARKGISPKK